MVRRYIVAAVAACVAGGALLAACGGSSGGSEASVAHGSARTGAGPATREVCESMVRDSVPATVGVPLAGDPVSGVRGDTFSCRYVFAGGTLDLSVRDLHTVARARKYFRALRGREGVNDALTGLADGGFTKADGSVVAMKDAMILTVDVTALPPTPADRTGIAIDLAGAVLGCWTGGS
ncbi:MAG TPA: hypothetical protein VKH36_02070 [Acidimicrobiia bacterium]|nr:hypothetical protein [Acidimicrobiia bacterium]